MQPDTVYIELTSSCPSPIVPPTSRDDGLEFSATLGAQYSSEFVAWKIVYIVPTAELRFGRTQQPAEKEWLLRATSRLPPTTVFPHVTLLIVVCQRLHVALGTTNQSFGYCFSQGR